MAPLSQRWAWSPASRIFLVYFFHPWHSVKSLAMARLKHLQNKRGRKSATGLKRWVLLPLK